MTTTTDTDSNWLREELARLRRSLRREVQRFLRAEGGRADNVLQGLVLGEQQILSILDERPSTDEDPVEAAAAEPVEDEPAARPAATPAAPETPLQRLAALFGLDLLERRCLVLCLAPEVEPGFARVYGFLQDDVTRRLPSVELALRLFSRAPDTPAPARASLAFQGALRRYRLVQFQDVQELSAPLSQRWMRLEERIAAYLLGVPDLDPLLAEWVRRCPREGNAPGADWTPGEYRERAARLVDACRRVGDHPGRPILHFHGRYGSGRRELAEQVCHGLGLPLLVASAARLPAAVDRLEAWWRLGRESRLQQSALLVEDFDELLESDRARERDTLLEAIRTFSPLALLTGRRPWSGDACGRQQVFLSVDCPVPDATARAQVWQALLAGVPHRLRDSDVVELSAKFCFTPGQVRDAVAAAQTRALGLGPANPAFDLAALNQACRAQATPHLGQFAGRIERAYRWEDLVLPAPLLAQLREIAVHLRRSQVVFEQWGFGERFPDGQGVTALFHGGSGTGKTMAASLIAAELALDLYRIDLSMVVSKYIGETEKNLNRVFAEAQDSNAILFFDEADALFGKRSPVKDAHDRYANIEIAYLLQRMEDYRGVVILASNMKHNLDDAFVRRMRFILHFPFPGVEERERIWRGAFPKRAPVGEDVDFAWLARKLKITGGYIKNISLRAAFLAAERGGVIRMDCVRQAARLELEKIGKTTELLEFQRPSEAQAGYEPAREVAA